MLVSIPSYGIEFFTVIGVLVVVGSMNSVREDLVDDKLVGSVFVGVFIVIRLILRVFFLIFVGKDVFQQFCNLFSVVVGVFFRFFLIGGSFLFICIDCRVLS